MNITQLTVGAVALVACGAAGFGVFGFWTAGEAAKARTAANWRSEQARASIASLEMKLLTETKRAEAVESDNAALASAVQAVQAALAKPPVAPVSRETFAERVKQALALEKNGDADAAMRELLSCYDTAVARPEVLAGVQLSSIINALGKLVERHPPALAQLRERFERGKRRVLGNSDDTQPLAAMSMIARALKDDHAMVAVFDEIPAGDARRTKVAIYGVEGLIADKRYGDALMGRPWPSMISGVETGFADLPTGLFSADAAERIRESRRSYAIKTAAKNIEVLAGAGDLAHARELVGRVLALDNSETTRALLLTHLERAGRTELLTTAGKP